MVDQWGLLLAVCLGLALSVVSFAVMRLVMSQAIGQLTGWRRLCDRYPVRTPYRGEWQKMKSGRMGPVRLNHCLDIGTTSEYLYLASGFFSLPPMQIPWSAIRVARRTGAYWQLELGEDSIMLADKSLSPAGLAQIAVKE
jgi:hypothetical protein